MSRKRVEIKEEILEALSRFPRTTHGVAVSVNCHYETAEKNLEELQSRSVVKKTTQEEHGEEKQLWELV